MEFRTMDIKLYSVGQMNDVDFSKKMAVYAVVSISGGDETSIQEIRTPADATLTWNFPMKFKVDEVELQKNRLNLDFKLVGDDKDVGALSVPIKELLDSPAKALDADGMKFLVYHVRKRNGDSKGELSFTCKLSDPATPAPPPSYWGLMKEKFGYGVQFGGEVVSSGVKMAGAAASIGVESVKAAGWEAKKKLEEHAEKRERVDLAQKRIDMHKKEVEELRKKREEEAAKRRNEEEAAKKREEELAAKMRKEEEAAMKRKEEAAKKKRKEEEAAKKRKEEAAKKKEEEELAKKRAADLRKNPTQTESLYTKFTSGIYPTTQTGSMYTKLTTGLYSTTQTGLTTLMTQTGLVPGQTTDTSQASSSQVTSRQYKA